MFTGKYKLRSKLIRFSVPLHSYFSESSWGYCAVPYTWGNTGFPEVSQVFLKKPFSFLTLSLCPIFCHARTCTGLWRYLFSLSCLCFCLMLPILHLPVYLATVTSSPLNPGPPATPCQMDFRCFYEHSTASCTFSFST